METIFDIIKNYQTWFYWTGALSLIIFFGTLLTIPWLIIRLPADYFASRRRRRVTGKRAFYLWGIILIAGKNILGCLFVIIGIIMLMIPGQGILTIFIGIVLLDFPGKFRLERWLMRRRTIIESLNIIRRKARRPPLTAPE